MGFVEVVSVIAQGVENHEQQKFVALIVPV